MNMIGYKLAILLLFLNVAASKIQNVSKKVSSDPLVQRLVNSVNKLMYQHAADIEKTQKDIKKLEKKHDEDMKRLEPRKTSSCRQPYTARFKSSCYKFVLEPADWMKAYTDCRMDGAYLVSLETIEENIHIRDYIKSTPFLKSAGAFYTSGTDHGREGTWIWASTAQYVAIRNWGGHEPTHGVQENCLGLNKNFDWKWFDLPCASAKSYICEMFT